MIAQVLIDAVAYIRMSSDKQEASPAQQRAEITKLAERLGYKIIRWYVDDGIAGWKSEERKEFQRLISDATKRHDFRAVLCWDQNRFSRFPPLEANHYWYLLDKADVHLTTVNQGRLDWTSIAGWLTASIKQHADSQHRFQLSADVKRGKTSRAEKGEWQGRIPFAYIVVDRRLQLGDTARVEIIRRIFREYIEGRSLRGIAHRLNDEGLQAMNGGRDWQPPSIRHKLTNAAYAGIFQFNEIERRDNHPAIISVEDFETVQRLLGERQSSTTPKKDGGGFVFNRLLRCGDCRSPMAGWNRRGKLAYHCSGHKSKGKTFCELNTVKQDELLGVVVDTIASHFTNPKTVKRLREELHREVDREHSDVDPDDVRKQLSTIDRKLSKAKRRLVEVDTDMLPVVQEQIRELRGEQARMEAALKAAQMPRERMFGEADKRIDKAMALFSRLPESFRRADPLRLREFLREAIERIEVWTVRSGAKNHFRLDRGRVHLRGDKLFNSSERTFTSETAKTNFHEGPTPFPKVTDLT